MNAKEYLSQAYHLDRKIGYKLDQVKLLRDSMKTIQYIMTSRLKGM